MLLEWLLSRFEEHANADAVVWRGATLSYGQLLEKVRSATAFLRAQGVQAGESVLVDADFSPGAIALLLASIDHANIVVPVANHVKVDREEYARIAEATWHFRVLSDDRYEGVRFDREATHPLFLKLRQRQNPGLVLFSSGSTGQPKAAVHDVAQLLTKFKTPRHTQRLVSFLLFDHIGGFNTLMYALSNHGCVITLTERDPVSVCRAIQEHRVEVLPTSPTFLNLMLMSGAHRRFDLSSLKVINYATETMPESTLKRLHAEFPGVTLCQSYGLSETGILRSTSRSSDSVWIKVGGEDYQTRVIDGVLWIKSKMTMLGYVNAPSPYDADGWLNTQDEVEVDGEWIRIKGRKSDIINVGGEKVYPAEVESVIMEVPNIADVTVTKEAHPFTGNVVVAEVRLAQGEEIKQVFNRVRTHCFRKLPPYKVPVKIRLAEKDRVSQRFKKLRDSAATQE